MDGAGKVGIRARRGRSRPGCPGAVRALSKVDRIEKSGEGKHVARCSLRKQMVDHAEKVYDQGASDTSIKIGNTMPYSGPNSAFAVVGRTQAAYFKMITDQGGIKAGKLHSRSHA